MDWLHWLPLIALLLTSAVHRWSFVRLFENYFRLTLVDAPVYSLIFFGAWAFVFFGLFPEETYTLFAGVSVLGYVLILFILFVLFPYVFRYLRRRHGKDTPWLSKLYPGEGMLSLEERYIIAKVGDVFVQDLIAGIMIVMLLNIGFSYQATVGAFVVIFGLAHLYLLRTSGIMWGLYYTFFGVMGAFAIPFFIVFITGGMWYVLLLHTFLYVLFAAFFAYFPKPSRAVARDVMRKM